MQVQLDDYRAGAAVATALVNTGPDVQSSGEALPDPEALSRFLVSLDVPAVGRETGVQDVAEVHALRSALQELITAADVTSLATRAGELAAGTGMGPELCPDADGRWQWHVRTRPGASVADELTLITAVGLLGTLRALGPERFRRCASPACQGVFVDTSRAGRRRYCEPEVCGNRINVAAYRARRRAEHPDRAEPG